MIFSLTCSRKWSHTPRFNVPACTGASPHAAGLRRHRIINQIRKAEEEKLWTNMKWDRKRSIDINENVWQENNSAGLDSFPVFLFLSQLICEEKIYLIWLIRSRPQKHGLLKSASPSTVFDLLWFSAHRNSLDLQASGFLKRKRYFRSEQ